MSDNVQNAVSARVTHRGQNLQDAADARMASLNRCNILDKHEAQQMQLVLKHIVLEGGVLLDHIFCPRVELALGHIGELRGKIWIVLHRKT